MCKLPVVVFLSAVSLAFAAPAVAQTSVSKAHKTCETASRVLRPTPKSAKIDKDETRSSDDAIIVRLNVRTVDGALVDVTCTVNRATGVATLKPIDLSSDSASVSPTP
ncbi:MAG: hypothetical protein HC869_19720 [Rhodospirillales bacterium]|nr:hypothetical protein [Rhodospirillales bacterium]